MSEASLNCNVSRAQALFGRVAHRRNESDGSVLPFVLTKILSSIRRVHLTFNDMMSCGRAGERAGALRYGLLGFSFPTAFRLLTLTSAGVSVLRRRVNRSSARAVANVLDE